ncbi:hypothetical protein AMS68_003031 [Peltaster fructicola]|uniref:Rhodopsin domain-containing protein n=1 Tax=Peltaster fructicola TaxID=286661 RepID=A0A6H0XS01_9PEZI|nr:hypothetical protein AMS68_003031 [Peltaster fructicola]
MPGNFLPLWQVQYWPAPNYVDPVRRTWLPGYSIALQVISTILVATRLWLRASKQAGAWGWDDFLLIPTWITSVGFTATSILFMQYGGDRHVWDIPSSYFVPAIRNAWIAQLIYLISTTCVKVSVLLFYRRLVAGTYSKRWKYATIAAIWFTVGYCVAFIFVLIFGCNPTYAYWMSYDAAWLSTQQFTCVDAAPANLWAGILSVVSDVYAVLLPCLMLRHFDAPRRQKIALMVVFSFGMLVVGAGVARTYYFTGLAYTLDETWLGYDVYVWAQLELQLAIICASAPALRVFFRRYLSDPLNRAIHSAKATGSAIRSGHRNSNTIPEHSIVHYPSNHSRNVSEVAAQRPFNSVDDYMGEKGSTSYYTHVREEISPISTTTSEKPQAIRTPADFEHYALNNLERNRPFPPRPAYHRPSSIASETSIYDQDPSPHYHAVTR